MGFRPASVCRRSPLGLHPPRPWQAYERILLLHAVVNIFRLLRLVAQPACKAGKVLLRGGGSTTVTSLMSSVFKQVHHFILQPDVNADFNLLYQVSEWPVPVCVGHGAPCCPAALNRLALLQGACSGRLQLPCWPEQACPLPDATKAYHDTAVSHLVHCLEPPKLTDTHVCSVELRALGHCRLPRNAAGLMHAVRDVLCALSGLHRLSAMCS